MKHFQLCWTEVPSIFGYCHELCHKYLPLRDLQHQLARKNKNSKCLTDSGRNDQPPQISPTQNRKRRNWIIAFSCLHVCLRCDFIFFHISNVRFFDVQGFSAPSDSYCLVKCSYNHRLTWASPASPVYSFLPLCFPALMKDPGDASRRRLLAGCLVFSVECLCFFLYKVNI